MKGRRTFKIKVVFSVVHSKVVGDFEACVASLRKWGHAALAAVLSGTRSFLEWATANAKPVWTKVIATFDSCKRSLKEFAADPCTRRKFRHIRDFVKFLAFWGAMYCTAQVLNWNILRLVSFYLITHRFLTTLNRLFELKLQPEYIAALIQICMMEIEPLKTLK